MLYVTIALADAAKAHDAEHQRGGEDRASLPGATQADASSHDGVEAFSEGLDRPINGATLDIGIAAAARSSTTPGCVWNPSGSTDELATRVLIRPSEDPRLLARIRSCSTLAWADGKRSYAAQD